MEKQAYNRISACLNIFVDRLSKIAVFTPGAGLMKGKTGLAILLFEYAAYKDDKRIRDHADHLIDIAVSEISANATIDLTAGLCGIAWGLNYLIKRKFIQAEEDIFEEIDKELFKEIDKELKLYDFGKESEKALYISIRMNIDSNSIENVWHQRAEKYINTVHEILNLKNIWHSTCTCKEIFRFLHLCEILRSHGLFLSETEFLYEKLYKFVKFCCDKEKNISNKYLLDSLLIQIPIFADLVSVSYFPEKATLTDVIDFYQNKLISGREISVPKFVNHALLSIVEDKKRIDELLYLLNPNNAELGNYVGGLSWAMVQWCKENTQSDAPIRC